MIINDKVKSSFDTIVSKSGTETKHTFTNTEARSWKIGSPKGISRYSYGDEGSVARFFYVVETEEI